MNKSCPADPVIPGRQSTYTLTYGNSGSAPAYRVSLTDALPAGVTFVSASKPVCAQTPDGVLVFCPGNCVEPLNCRGDVAPGFSETINITVRVDATSGTLTNNAFIANMVQPGNCGHCGDQDSCTSLVAAPDLEVIKTGPSRAFLGSPVNFIIMVNNRGAGPADNVRVVDTFNPTLLDCSTLVASPTQGTCSADCAAGTITCSLGTIPGGGTAGISISMVSLTDRGIQGVIDNCAAATTTTPETDTTNNKMCIQVPAGSVDVFVDPACPPTPAIAGTEAIWSVQVSNLGNQSAQGVTVTDTLPEGVRYVDSAPAPSGVSVDGRTLTYQLGTIGPLSGVGLKIRGLMPQNAVALSNTVSATSTSPESSLTNNAGACSIQSQVYDHVMNFEPSTSLPAPGFMTDTGATYSPTSGFGWSSSISSRDRGMNPLQQLDTFVYSYDAKRWEMAVPNGDYEVAVVVGDPQYAQGPQRVVVEGITAVNDEMTAAGQFLTRTLPAAVRDGMLTVTIGNSSAYTTLDYLACRLAASQPAILRSINFQPASAPAQPGFSVDGGAVYDATRGYGWNSAIDSRDRNLITNQLLDTFVFSSTSRVWEIDVPNGTYEVTFSIGDALYTQGPQQVKIEGATVIGALTTAAGQFTTSKSTVTVSDGRLTIEIGGGGGNTTLNFVTIASKP